MPLFILGFLLLISLLIYSIVRYINSGEEDTRSVRERYPMAFPPRHKNGEDSAEQDEPEEIRAEGYVETDSFMGDVDHIIRNLKETLGEKAREYGIDTDKLKDLTPFSGRGSEDDDEDNTVQFPTDNVEEEKHKRNINSN